MISAPANILICISAMRTGVARRKPTSTQPKPCAVDRVGEHAFHRVRAHGVEERLRVARSRGFAASAAITSSCLAAPESRTARVRGAARVSATSPRR
jgi:hypothetical protein